MLGPRPGHQRQPARLAGRTQQPSTLWPCCGCRRCSCVPCVRIRPTPRWPAIACWSGRATSAAPRRVASPGCRSGGSSTATSSASSARRWTPPASRRCTSRRCCRERRTRRRSRWTDYGDNMFRLKDRRGNDYLLAPTHEEMFTLLVKDLYIVLQGPAAGHLPDPDEVPRRGPPAGRPAPRPRVRDEGLLQLRRRRRRARRLATSAIATPTSPRSTASGCRSSSCRRCRGAMGGSASEEFLAPIDAGEDTYVRCPNCDYAANIEAVRVVAPPPRPHDGLAAGGRRTTRPTPRRSHTLVDLLNARDDLARDDDRAWAAGRHAEERRRSCSGTPTDPPSRSPSACRATATSTSSDSRRSDPARRGRRRSARPTSPGTPCSSRATSGRVRSGRARRAGIRFLVDPRVVDGTAWVTGADAPGHHVIGPGRRA